MRTQPTHKDLSISLYKTCALLYEFIELSPPPPPNIHKNHAVGTFHTQYTAYQKHQCHRCDAPTSPPLIRDFSQWTCFCENRFFHAPHLPIVWQE
mgnify:CR=1 FL=1